MERIEEKELEVNRPIFTTSLLSKKETSGGNVVVPGPGSPILPVLLLLYTVHIQLLHSISLAIDSPRSYP